MAEDREIATLRKMIDDLAQTVTMNRKMAGEWHVDHLDVENKVKVQLAEMKKADDKTKPQDKQLAALEKRVKELESKVEKLGKK